jgi:hypothetical protein
VARVMRPTPQTAFIEYYPSVPEQVKKSTQGLSGQFVVQYDVERDYSAGDVLVLYYTNNLYSLRFSSTSQHYKTVTPKTIISTVVVFKLTHYHDYVHILLYSMP